MRIKQFLCITGIHFERGFTEKYGFVPYTNVNEPLFISGFGREILKNLDRISKHKSLIVLRWAGGDLIWFLTHPIQARRIASMKNIHHIAISRCLERDLKTLGVPYTFLPISVYKNNDIKPEPLGDSIYVYRFKDSKYGLECNQRLEKLLPDIYFIKSESVFSYPRSALFELYRKCFLGLRMTNHDGLSNTVCEMGLMGRKVLHNGDTPNCIHYGNPNDISGIAQVIRNEYNNRHNIDPGKIAQEVYNYLDVGEQFLNTEFYDNRFNSPTSLE